MFYRLIYQSLFRDWREKALALSIIAVAATLAMALLSVSIDVGDKMARELKSFGANLELIPKGEEVPLEIGGVNYNPLKGQTALEEHNLVRIKEIYWRNNVIGFAPWVRGTVRMEGTESALPLMGTEFERVYPLEDDPEFSTGVRLINAYWSIEGVWPDQTEEEACLVGVQLASRLGLGAGDHIVLIGARSESLPLKVSGILTTGGEEDEAFVLSLSQAQHLLAKQNMVDRVQVSALAVPEDDLSIRAHKDPDSLDAEQWDRWYCTAYVSSIAHQLEEAFPNTVARPVWQVVANEGAIIKKIQSLLFVVSIAAVVAAIIGVSSFMSLAIMKRSEEIGLMKALGAHGHSVYVLFLAESASVGLVGGIMGCLAGTGLAQVISFSVFGAGSSQPWIVYPTVVLVSCLTAVAGSLAPARIITRIQPAQILHGRH